MQSIFNVVLPVFAIMAAGFLVGRAGLLGEDSSRALNGFVYYVALPALFFGSLAEVPLDEIFHWPFIAAFSGGVLGSFALALAVAVFFFPNRVGGLALNALCSVFSNTGYMGVPLLLLAFGDSGLLPAIITTVITGSVLMAVGIVLLEADRHASHDGTAVVRKVGVGLAKNPLILSAVAGIVYSASGLPVPAPVASFMSIVGAAAGPCALFAIGLFMVGKHLTAGMTEVLWVTAIKLVLMPLISWWLAFEVMALEPMWAKAAVIQAALPTGALTFVLAQQYAVYVQRATAVILVSTLLSLVTLSLAFVLLGIE